MNIKLVLIVVIMIDVFFCILVCELFFIFRCCGVYFSLVFSGWIIIGLIDFVLYDKLLFICIVGRREV